MTSFPQNTEIFYTQDGSPTLSFTRGDGYKEKMHHSGGALAESLFIYHEALKAVCQAGLEPRVLSVGLGLGYNELLTMADRYAARELLAFKIWSFEPIPELREGFREWALGEDDGGVARVLTEVCAKVAAHFALPPGELRAFASKCVRAGRLELRGAFPNDADGVLANTVYYDAYSRKMDEHLWDEQMLFATFGKILAPDCILATYARTGNLNRSLHRLGFRPSGKTGFMGKRESTMAFRGRVG